MSYRKLSTLQKKEWFGAWLLGLQFEEKAGIDSSITRNVWI